MRSETPRPGRSPTRLDCSEGWLGSRRAGTVTLDRKRHGTTALFAGPNTLDGTMITMCAQQQHRREEWL
jgi:hypothetical protein